MQANNNSIITFVIAITILIVLLVAVIITILYIHQNRRISFHENLANTQLEIQEETFQHISREIHDNIGLSLSLAKLHLNNLSIELDTKNEITNENKITIGDCIDLISQGINDLSYASKNLNSEAIQSEGFLSALKIKLEKIGQTKKFKVILLVTGDTYFLDSQSELIMYRIAQEALNNIIKHSKANVITVNLEYTDNELLMEINDNGVGIDWANMEKEKSVRMSAGLNNMKKRAKMINGSCNIKSSPYNGTTVLITIPFQTNEKRTN